VSEKWQEVDDGLSARGICYIWELKTVGIRRDVEDYHKTLRKKISGSQDTIQATSSILMII
jgi:hypothetical protein